MGTSSTKTNSEYIKESISEKIFNSRVKIKINSRGNNICESGFFVELNIMNKNNYFLISCNNFISKEYINEEIEIIYGKKSQEKSEKIKLDKSERIIKFLKKPIDVTLIEILESDNIEKNIFYF